MNSSEMKYDRPIKVESKYDKSNSVQVKPFKFHDMLSCFNFMQDYFLTFNASFSIKNLRASIT